MLWTIQFPLVDLRPFVKANTGKLQIPSWLSPIPEYEFVRSFGMIRRRPRGGLSGWVGESMICEAKRAVRFRELKSYRSHLGGLIKVRVAFRRFYFDGLAVGKFEIGLAMRGLQRGGLSRKETGELCNHLIGLPIVLPGVVGEQIRCPLWQCRLDLGRLYLVSSSSTKSQVSGQGKLRKWWVQACPPVILVSYHKKREDVQIPLPCKSVPISGIDAVLSHHMLPYEGQRVRMWVVGEGSLSPAIRQLRIFLLRLHAERECLRQVLRSIATGKLVVTPRSEQSERLQQYLNESTKHISRLGRYANQRVEAEIGELAREAEDYIDPGECDALFSALSSVDIRRNIFRKVEDFVQKQTIVKEQVMGDKYTILQAGAVGPHSHAHDIRFTQVWKQISNDVDLVTLAKELSVLRQELRQNATEAEHDAATGEVASAEMAARSGDGPAVIKHLSKAGRWAFEVATKIGVSVAAKAIQFTLGF